MVARSFEAEVPLSVEVESASAVLGDSSSGSSVLGSPGLLSSSLCPPDKEGAELALAAAAVDGFNAVKVWVVFGGVTRATGGVPNDTVTVSLG